MACRRLALAWVAVMALHAAPSSGQRLRPTATVTFPAGVQVQAEIVDTPETRDRGLMFRKSLGSNEGMLFVSSRPTEGVRRDLARLKGDLVVLGASGKMGPTLVRMARRCICPIRVRRWRSWVGSCGAGCSTRLIMSVRAARGGGR